jgi:hypothetical protein
MLEGIECPVGVAMRCECSLPAKRLGLLANEP